MSLALGGSGGITLRDFYKAQGANAPHLFAPRAAYRFHDVNSRPLEEPGARIVGKNPP